MRSSPRSIPQNAFTLLEGVVVLAVVCVLAVFLFIPTLGRASRSKRIHCVSNLKQIGLATRVSANDNQGSNRGVPDLYRVVGVGGKSTSDLENPSELWRHYAAHSNLFGTPKVLACPADTRRSLLNTWESVITNDHNGAISYALGLYSTEEQPRSILNLDRNLSLDGLPVGTAMLTLTTNSPVGFHTTMHNLAGNVLLGDGSVQQLTSLRLRELVRDAIQAQTNSVGIRIVVP